MAHSAGRPEAWRPRQRPQVLLAPDPDGPWLRHGQPQDAEALCAIHVRAILEACRLDYPPEQLAAWVAPYRPAWHRQALADPGLWWWVGGHGEAPGGFACWDPNGWVTLLYVDPTQARRGLGRALLGAVEAEAKLLGLPGLRLKATVTAAPFYRGLGYQDGGRTEDGVGKACHRMRKDWGGDPKALS